MRTDSSTLRSLVALLCALPLGLTAACGPDLPAAGPETAAPTIDPTMSSTMGPAMPLEDTGGPVECGDAGVYCWAGSTGIVPTFYKVWGTAANDYWIAGSKGTLLHWNGQGWAQLPAGMVTADLHGLWGSGASDVWAVGDAGTMLHWNGSAWSTTTSGTSSDLYAVWGSAANDVWAVGDGGALLHWNGTKWGTATKPSLVNRLNGVWGSAANDVWAVGAWGLILHYDGTAWTQSTSPVVDSLIGVYGNSAHDVWAVGTSSTMLHWNGTSWFDSSRSLGVTLTELAGTSSGNLWAVGENATLLNWNGLTWDSQTYLPQLQGRLNSIWSQGNTVAVVGDAGFIVRWDMGAFQHIGYPAGTPTINSIWAASRTDLWAVGSKNTVLRWNGSTWTNILFTGTVYGSNLHQVWGSSSNDVWMAGEGDVFHWDGTKISNLWSPLEEGIYNAIWASGPTDAWLIENGKKLYHYNGTTWVSMDASRPTDAALTAIWGSGPSDVWVLGSVLSHWNGTSWAASLPFGGAQLTGKGANDIWIGGSGLVHYDGTAWAPFSTKVTGSSNWQLYDSGPNDVWATASGRLMHYDGRAFTAVYGLGSTMITGIAGTDLWIGSPGDLYHH